MISSQVQNPVDKVDDHSSFEAKIAAGFDFIKMPSVSSQYLSPDTTPGEGDLTVYSFSVDYDANYSLDVFAYHEPLNHEGFFQPYAAYYMPNGTWVIGACSRPIFAEEKWTVWVGIGLNASSISWQAIGQANTTIQMAIAANATSIRLVYLESDQLTQSSNEPAKWVKYFATDDWGTIWRNDTLWDVSAWPDTWFSGVSMAARGNNFECLWGFSNASEDFSWARYEIASVWEARSVRNGWTQPANLTALVGNASYAPQVFFNQSSGKIYACVNNYTGTFETESLLLELGDGIDAQATDIWALAPPAGQNGYSRQVYCTLDYENNVFYFINHTNGQDGVRNATGWKGELSNVDLCETGARDSYYFNLFAKGGKPKIFAGSILSNTYGYKAGLLECDPPFFFYHLNNSINSAETMFYVFNGRDSNGLTHGARSYYFNLTVIREDGNHLHNQLIVTRDDVPPEIQLTATPPAISPFASPGVLDSFEVNVTASKAGTAMLAIESLDRQINGSVDITEGIYSYMYPALCGDGIRNFLFYAQMEGTLIKLMFTKSSDGGLSWTNPIELMRTTSGVSLIKAIYREQKLYCWMEASETHLFISPDEGESFVNAEMAALVRQVAGDLSCWYAYWADTEPYQINLSRSLDLGMTWSDFISVPITSLKEFSHFDGVAYDPISGNYSFILTNQTTNHTRFITSNNDGTIFTSWDGFGDNGHGYSTGYTYYTQLDCRLLSDDASEWIITSCDYNEGSFSSMTTNLAYTTTKGDGQFSDWKNFTGISGTLINTTLAPYWDIFFPGNATPCFVTAIFNLAAMQFPQMRVDYGTRLVFDTRDDLASTGNLSLSFNGLSNAFEILADGAYSWTLKYADLGGQSSSRKGTLEIDNTVPVLNPYANLTTPEHPDPRYPVIITIPTSDARLSSGMLLYRTSPIATWIPIEMTRVVTGPISANFTGTIPIQGDVTVYWRVVINDTAGNTLVVDNAGQLFTYTKPQLRLEEEFEPPTSLDLSEHSTYEVRFLVPEDSEYMESVVIHYTFDDGTGTHVAFMSRTSTSIFNFTFSTFPANVTTLTYTVIGIDVYGNQVPFERSRTIALIPALPLWEMSPIVQVFVLLISLAVGIVCGIVYSSMIRQRTGGRILTKELVERVVQESRAQASLELQEGGAKKLLITGEKTSVIALSFALAGGAAGILGAALYILVYQWPEAAMLCLAGTMLAMVFLWILTTDSAVRRTLRENKAKIPVGKILGIFLVGLTIFASVLAILFVGNTVAWWRVRVNEDAYIILGLELPSMITTLAGTFFSSIILLTWSVGKDVNKTFQELQDAEINNENPGRIIALREARLANILGAVGWKGVLFIAIIGATLIFASDLSVYTSQGLLIIIPFVVGAVVMLAVSSLRRLKAGGKTGLAPMFFDRVSKCPSCGTETPVGGAFCENCGLKVIIGERVKEGQYCSACHQPTSAGVKHCRYCGNALNITPAAPNQQVSEGEKKDSP